MPILILPVTFFESLKSAADFIHAGGFFMYVLLGSSFVALTVVVWRAMVLRRDYVVPESVCSQVNMVDNGDQAQELARELRQHSSPLARLVVAAVDGFRISKMENAEALQSKAREEVVRMERGNAILEVIITIAPLLGLLGTVVGLVNVFANLGSGGLDEVDPQKVAQGIALALNTTIGGLAVAVPCVIAHSYFARKIELMSVKMEVTVGGLLARCYGHAYIHDTSLEASPQRAEMEQFG